MLHSDSHSVCRVSKLTVGPQDGHLSPKALQPDPLGVDRMPNYSVPPLAPEMGCGQNTETLKLNLTSLSGPVCQVCGHTKHNSPSICRQSYFLSKPFRCPGEGAGCRCGLAFRPHRLTALFDTRSFYLRCTRVDGVAHLGVVPA